FGERRFRRIAFLVALREHLLHEPEAVVADERRAARVAAHREQVPSKRLEIAARECDVLTCVIAVTLDELRHLRLTPPIEAYDERVTEAAVVDAPELHAAVRIVGADVVDSSDQLSALDLDMKPRPLLDRALRACVGHMVHLREMRHQTLLPREDCSLPSFQSSDGARERIVRSPCPVVRNSSVPVPASRSASASTRRARTRCGRSSIRPSSRITPAPGHAANAATTVRARSISSRLGVKISFRAPTCAGWIASLPAKPSRFAASA